MSCSRFPCTLLVFCAQHSERWEPTAIVQARLPPPGPEGGGRAAQLANSQVLFAPGSQAFSRRAGVRCNSASLGSLSEMAMSRRRRSSCWMRRWHDIDVENEWSRAQAAGLSRIGCRRGSIRFDTHLW